MTETMSQPATTPSTLHPRNVNHLALSTCDMKAQLTFFADVLGCPTKALYWMHGVENTFHGFVELAGDTYLAFVQHPDNSDAVDFDVTHARNAGAPVTKGTMQHLAFGVDSMDELVEMRDRIRGNGVQVMGPIDHGFIQSIYFAGLEGMSLEVACGSDINEEAWIDPEVTGLCEISPDELERLKHPVPFERPEQAIAQPGFDADRFFSEQQSPSMNVPDDVIWERASETTPPVQID
ncbi:MAG: VOC family protein [Actinomycetota bacterium]|nr:VOC family protein [Actinomycetota bacterium]